jgi:hypothetical protein
MAVAKSTGRIGSGLLMVFMALFHFLFPISRVG